MPRKASLKLFIVAAATVLFLPACLATKPYDDPDLDPAGLYHTTEPVELDRSMLGEMPWQEFFDDPVLRDLIAEALRNNLDLRDAIQQIRVAEANFYEGKLALYPDLYGDGNVSRSSPSDNGAAGRGRGGDVPATQNYSAALSSTWQVDLWGRLTSAKRAAFATLLQREATRRAVQTRIVADVANTYYRLLALDRQIDVTRETVDNRAADVNTVEALKEGAVLTGVDVQQSIANLYAARVTLPQLQQQITEQENALSLLLGRKPGAIDRTTLAQQDPVDSLATGVPAQLLRNRPDLIAAEQRFRSAFELTNSARAYFYPSLTLTAEGGLESLSLKDLLDPGSLFYNLAAGITQPIFAQGRNEARLKRRKARQRQARLGLRRTLLQAGSDVSNALSLYRNAGQQLDFRDTQLGALAKAVDYSRELLRYGEANYIQVLTARQNLLTARLNSVEDRLDQLQAGVDLYQALGGGWNRSENPVAPDAEATPEGGSADGG